MHVCIDAGPTENAHRTRGIGACTRQILGALTPALAGSAGARVSYLRWRPLPWEEAERTAAVHAPRRPLALLAGAHPRVPVALAQQVKGLDAACVLPGDVARTGADVFLATDPGAVALDDRFGTVAVLYDAIPLAIPGSVNALDALWFRRALSRMRRCQAIVAISEASRRDGIRLSGLDPSRIRVVPLAVDGAIFHPLAVEECRLVAARLGVRRPYLLYAGGFDPRKGVDRLVDAFAGSGLPATHDLLLVGALVGPRGVAIGARARRSPAARSIRLLGFVSDGDLAHLYGGASAFVFPSVYEGFGLPVLEAMACGAPVIAHQVSSIPEVAGDAALYVEPAASEALARAMARVVGDPGLREDLRARGLARAAGFSWGRTAKGMVEACREAVRRG